MWNIDINDKAVSSLFIDVGSNLISSQSLEEHIPVRMVPMECRETSLFMLQRWQTDTQPATLCMGCGAQGNWLALGDQG